MFIDCLSCIFVILLNKFNSIQFNSILLCMCLSNFAQSSPIDDATAVDCFRRPQERHVRLLPRFRDSDMCVLLSSLRHSLATQAIRIMCTANEAKCQFLYYNMPTPHFLVDMFIHPSIANLSYHYQRNIAIHETCRAQ